jgi:sensor histidine kinase YesM
VVAVGDDLGLAGPEAVERSCDADGEGLDAAAEGVAVGCCAEQVEVVVEDREVDQTEAEAVLAPRERRAQRRGKELLLKVRLEKHVLELEQKALRLQMNPHFIFNALQSINGYISRNDSAEARKYLAKFGKLMRMTLENSRTSYTSIEQQTELLYNYTALEARSYGNRFETSIDSDE